ncbi:MAG: hypothetical protein K0R54_735 [Clostridiaceae bacterium]|jgi:hypothetical protein|nr:hypothetical protein [Clostridiaceae bacterium]
MNIIFKNKSGDVIYIVTDVNYGFYKNETTTYVGGGYDCGEGIVRRMPAKLFKCKKTGRPMLKLCGGKMYAVNIEDDKLFNFDILDKALIK